MKLHYFLIIIVSILSGCSAQREMLQNDKKMLRIKGSDSMLLLVERFAERYMSEHPGESISVEGGGSGVGIQALISGSIDICASSRPLSPDEVKQLAERYHSLGVSILCAKDALSIIVHPFNTVKNLSRKEIKDIFTGNITNWNEVGGADVPITVYGRESNSGTFLYFEEHVLSGEEYADNCIVIPGARALVNAVAHDSSAIGYSTFVYTNHVASVSVNNVVLTTETVRSGTYPITRYLYFYTVHPPEGEVKKFIDWVIGQDGQKVVKANGYIPLYDTD